MALLGIAAIGFLFFVTFGKTAAQTALKAFGVLVLLIFVLALASIIHAQNQPPTWTTASDPSPVSTYYATHPKAPSGIAPPGYHFNFFGRIVPDEDHGAPAR